jgi:hypothetical protein
MHAVVAGTRLNVFYFQAHVRLAPASQPFPMSQKLRGWCFFISAQPSAISYQRSAVSGQLSVISFYHSSVVRRPSSVVRRPKSKIDRRPLSKIQNRKSIVVQNRQSKIDNPKSTVDRCPKSKIDMSFKENHAPARVVVCPVICSYPVVTAEPATVAPSVVARRRTAACSGDCAPSCR